MRFLLAAGVAITVGIATFGPAVMAASGADDGTYSTWIESKAARAFDQATPQIGGVAVSYRIDAHVLLPLGFASLPLWERQDVGSAVASYRDSQDPSGRTVRAYEVFAISNPARAQGFDRCGFFREALMLSETGAEWTAYFGAMTTWAEKTLSEAQRAANAPQPHTYEAIDGISSPLEARAAVYQVSTDNRMTSSLSLWSAVRPQLERREPRSVKAQAGTAAKPLPSLAFIGAVEASLRSAAVHRAKPLPRAATSVPFTYNGVPRRIELQSMSPDPRRGQKAVAAGFARNAADVFELRFRIYNATDSGEFVLWAELPPGTADDAMAPPMLPTGWEMSLRSYLRLAFERTR
jgi:hypothetical protein